MEKRGDITDQTPGVKKPLVKTGLDKTAPRQPASKTEADSIQDHTTTRLANAAAKETKKNS